MTDDQIVLKHVADPHNLTPLLVSFFFSHMGVLRRFSLVKRQATKQIFLLRGHVSSRQLSHGIAQGHPDSGGSHYDRCHVHGASSKRSPRFSPTFSDFSSQASPLPLGEGRNLAMETLCSTKLEVPLRRFKHTSCSTRRLPNPKILAPRRYSRVKLAAEQERRPMPENSFSPVLDFSFRGVVRLAAAAGASVLLSCSSPAIAESLTVAFPVSKVQEVKFYELKIASLPRSRPSCLILSFLNLKF